MIALCLIGGWLFLALLAWGFLDGFEHGDKR